MHTYTAHLYTCTKVLHDIYKGIIYTHSTLYNVYTFLYNAHYVSYIQIMYSMYRLYNLI